MYVLLLCVFGLVAGYSLDMEVNTTKITNGHTTLFESDPTHINSRVNPPSLQFFCFGFYLWKSWFLWKERPRPLRTPFSSVLCSAAAPSPTSDARKGSGQDNTRVLSILCSPQAMAHSGRFVCLTGGKGRGLARDAHRRRILSSGLLRRTRRCVT